MAHDQDPAYVLAAGATFLVLCTIVVALRFSTRLLQKANFGIDDYLTIPSLLLVIGCATVLIIGVNLRVLAYPTPPPTNVQDPKDEKSYNFTKVEKVLRLQMTTSRKVAVLAVFGLGAVALMASLIRMALFINIVEIAEGKVKAANLDNNLLVTRGLYWSTLESGLALTACCLPTLNALARLPALRSVIDSIRSVVSLSSFNLGSQKLSVGNDSHQFKTEDEYSMASRTAFVPNDPKSANFETYAMGNVSKTSRQDHGERKEDIWVDKVIEQRDNVV
ncbi:hypothetical protein G7Y89_g7613 [Cudoniella acicularis]|uniref:Rhodopsin domain-containing protein n=1 Tax=Cudoniella acicularis TaxID=354080 RepID=A0A8H4RI42_9HELO|nr:hypothetical protein G7Y89_g7613 [Cudoniella acicularis]